MGCGGSKADEASLVALCRERKRHIRAASEFRYALAASHVAYFHSLRDVGDAILKFVEDEAALGSPVLHLPSRERKLSSPSSSSPPHRIDESNLGSPELHSIENHANADLDSHIHLSSSEEDNPASTRVGSQPTDSGMYVEPYSGESSTIYPGPVYGYGYNYPGPFPYPYAGQTRYPPNGNQNFNAYYMRKAPSQARTVLEDPGYSGSGLYYGESSRNERKPPPAPPSPNASTWDFFNVFEDIDVGSGGYYPEYYPGGRYGYGSGSTSSPDSKDVREREGIPELEDETEITIIKEVDEETNKSKMNKIEDDEQRPINSEPDQSSIKGKGIIKSTSSDSFSSSVISSVSLTPEEQEEIAQFVKQEGASSRANAYEPPPADELHSSKLSTLSSSSKVNRDLKDVAIEIRREFDSATSIGKEVALILEAGKLPYHRRASFLKVIISRILHIVTPSSSAIDSLDLSPRTLRIAREYANEISPDIYLNTKCLSSTLHQLNVWEKKLYKEVKDEERLRSAYDKKCKRLESLDRRGAEPSKIHATTASITALLTKINVSIRAVNSISTKINRLRDEELQPQMTQLISGLIRMWKAMLRCHQNQMEAIIASKIKHLRPNMSDSKSTIALESEVMNWCSHFNEWVASQKSYIRSLNEWLSRCLSEPATQEAPAIFAMCSDWDHAMKSVSEGDVEGAMIGFARKLHELWGPVEGKKGETEIVRKRIEKRLQALRMESELLVVDGTVDLDMMRSQTVQSGLVPIFEALGKFAGDVLNVHQTVLAGVEH